MVAPAFNRQQDCKKLEFKDQGLRADIDEVDQRRRRQLLGKPWHQLRILIEQDSSDASLRGLGTSGGS